MSNAKISFTKFVTAKGTAGYTYLDKPDTKFKDEGEYRAQIILTQEAFAPLLEKLEAELEKSIEKAKEENKGKKIKVADLPYKENDDGTITLNVKSPAFITSKKTGEKFDLKPAIFDAAGNRLVNSECKLGAGSTVKISGEVRPFFTALVGAGITLRLKAVQVIKLVEYGGGGNASGFGFGEEEGGYVADSPKSAAESAGFSADDDDVDF